MIKNLFVILIMLFSTKLYAFDYSRDVLICVVNDVHHMGEVGRLNRSISLESGKSLFSKFKKFIGFDEYPSIYAEAIKSKFSISRKSGAISGSYIKNDIWNKNVMDQGSDVQSVKILSTSGGRYLHVMYLQVDLFVAGENKPFIFVDGSTIYSGLCE